MAKTRKTKDVKADILLAALPDVAFDGWTDELLTRAIKKTGIPAAEVHAHFPQGAFSLVCYFSEWADNQMAAKLTPAKLKPLRISEKITLAVRTRLEILAPYKAAVTAALTFMAVPPKSFLLAKQVWQTADAIWWLAGDTATDYNHYTKRALLSGVISSTGIYWLNDDSRGHDATWKFLDARIANVLAIGKKISSFKKRA